MLSNTEWSLLLAACSPRGHATNIKASETKYGNIRWKTLLELSDRHKVQPLLYQFLSEQDGVPSHEMRVLGQLHQANVHKTLLLARELIRIIDHFSEAGIEILPYKGIALSEVLYGDIAARAAGDIDLLVRPQDVGPARNVLRELGYTPHLAFSLVLERAFLKSGYEYTFDGAAGPNLVEIQWAVQPRFYAVDLSQEDLFRRAVPVSIAGHVMKTPCPEDLFILLALHAAKHLWGRLIWLSDLARLGSLPNLTWQLIGKQSQKLGINRILRVTFLLMKGLLSVDIPAAADAAIPRDSEASLLASEIQSLIERRTVLDPESLSYFGLILRLRERNFDRVRFVSRLAFTPGPAEWAIVRLPGPLFPAYRLVRFFRLVRRFSKL